MCPPLSYRIKSYHVMRTIHKALWASLCLCISFSATSEGIRFTEGSWEEIVTKTNDYMKKYLAERFEGKVEGTDTYVEALEYSIFSGGKRFRPALVLMTGEAFGVSDEKLLPFAAAVEMVHCFSLVHDDLPCMDNDDFRRGKPTVHRAYSEDIALLAGDGLLCEAVQLLTEEYADEPELAVKLISLLMNSSGSTGMIAGQVVDLKAQKEKLDIAELEQVHLHKTGALIRCCTQGAALIAGLSAMEQEHLSEFALQLGLSFQIKDDLLEVEDNKVELGSYPGLIGVVATNKLLMESVESSRNSLSQLKGTMDHLVAIVDFNSKRSN